MKKYAILIGNSHFPDESDKSKLPDLACPEKDVDGLSTVLASERGEFEVLPLKNQPSYQILRELQRKVKQADSEDLLLLYYSGHGKPNKSGLLHLTTLDTVIAELETSAIPINRVYDILGTGKARKIVILLDCCYSGAAGQGFKGAVDDQLQQLNNARGTYLVTASTELQVAHESAEEGLSLFTKHLIAGLETGEADKDGDGWVNMDELYHYVYDEVVKENPAQQPTKHVKEERGDLFIAKSGRDLQREYNKKIEAYFYDLVKEKRITKDILINVLELLEKNHSQFSAIEKQQYAVIEGVFENKFEPVDFIRKWERLTFDIEKMEQAKTFQAKLAQEKATREKAEKEKAEQKRLEREKETHYSSGFYKLLEKEQERLEREKEAQQKVKERTANAKLAEEQKTFIPTNKTKESKNYLTWRVVVACILIVAIMIMFELKQQGNNESFQSNSIKDVSTSQNEEQQTHKEIDKTADIIIVPYDKKRQINSEIDKTVSWRENLDVNKLLEGVEFENSSDGKGVVITQLIQNSFAAFSGLRQYDIIIGTNKMEVDNLRDLDMALSRSSEVLLLQVNRNGRVFYLAISPNEMKIWDKQSKESE